MNAEMEPVLSILKTLKDNPYLREQIEGVITKSHRQWRSIPETTYLVLKAIEDYLEPKC